MSRGLFVFDRSAEVKSSFEMPVSVIKAAERFKRDCSMVLTGNNAESVIILEKSSLEAEQYRISVLSENQLKIEASEELGFIYAFLWISEHALGFTPFWFWNDCIPEKRENASVDEEVILSYSPAVRFRGWFINDEVLFMKWPVDGSLDTCWEMAMEALLRCGGNLVIPGTDKNSRTYRKMAAEMGLWITHHHAEPLGAEMFSRAYPTLTPSYAQYPEKYQQLWKDALEIQKDNKVIWTLGFRGQGDTPFWNQDPRYKTDEQRGKLISDVIRLQYDFVRERYPQGVCCTNLYGEIMDLYRKGCISLPDDVIRIWADNGYGKMVSRRQGNVNPRVVSVPQEGETQGHHGTYYHVSFYDLQAANHITMLPNTAEFVERELDGAYKAGIRDLWLINSSNIKPHVYYLDEIRRLWNGERPTPDEIADDYVRTYYSADGETARSIAACYDDFAKNTIKYGGHEDEHAGEQFTNYVTRIFTWAWRNNKTDCVKAMIWAAGEKPFAEQMNWYKASLESAEKEYSEYLQRCRECSGHLSGHDRMLFEDSIRLQAEVYYSCIQGAVLFCRGYEAFAGEEYLMSFFCIGQAAEAFDKADKMLHDREHDKWKGFYFNECLCDIKFTAYELRQLMGYIRGIGDGPHYYTWLRQVMYSKEDRKVALISHIDNHPTDEELYNAMKNQDCDEWAEKLTGLSDAD